MTITFTPEVKQEMDDIDGFDDDFACEDGFGDDDDDAEEKEGHIVQVFVLPTEEEAMDLCAALTEHLGESNNLFV